MLSLTDPTDVALLEYLVPFGFIPGQRVKLTEAAAYRGVIKLECNGAEVVVGYEVAGRIWVRGANRDEKNTIPVGA